MCYILVHDVHPFSSSSFNLTHTIKHLSFGQQLESIPRHGISPLDSTESIAGEGKYNIILRLILLSQERNYLDTY